jgi:thiol-disulfide isomerase/thioredoxin
MMTLSLAIWAAAAQDAVAWGASLDEALRGGRPVVALLGADKRAAFADPRIIELSRSFACVCVTDRAVLERLEARESEVRIHDAGGTLVSRLLFAEGARDDAERIRAELAWALEEFKRATPREIPLPVEGRERIGAAAPAWALDGWLQGSGEPAGKVTLVRFFTNTCLYCARSMPAFQSLHEKYGPRGLQVLGFYHPKPLGANRSRESVQKMLEAWGATFPIGLDTQWKTLRAFWLDGPPRGATSASFLIDRRGTIRWLHPGPELHPGDDPGHEACRRAFEILERAIERLLAEEARVPR